MAEQQSTAAAVELTQEQEELAQQVYQKLEAKVKDELLAMVRMMVAKPDHEIFGPGEFELRDKLNDVGATILAEAVNERSKKRVLR